MITTLMRSAALSACALAAAAAEFFVATTGSDSNAGTQGSPFKTLNKAIATANPGDTVWMRGGTHFYQNAVSPAKVGSASSWITVDTWPADLASGGKAILDGTNSSGTMNNKDDWSGSDAFYWNGGAYYRIRNLEVRNVKRIGVSFWANAGGHHVEFIDCDFRTIYRGAVLGSNGTDLLFERCRFWDCARVNKDFVFGHSGGWPSIVNCGKERTTIRDCEIFDSWGEGIGCYGKQHLITRNRLHDNYSVDIYVNNVVDTVVERNFVYTLGKTAFYRNFGSTPAAAAGIECANEGGGDENQFNNNRIVNNVVVGARKWHFMWWSSAGGGLRNSVIANNVFHGSSQNGAIVQIDSGTHTDAVFANNIVVSTGGSIVSGSGGTNLTRGNNCWFGGSAGGMAGTGDVSADPRLVNPGTNTPSDYALQAGSPCIDAGRALPQVTNDYAGSARSGTFEIGAFVHAGTVNQAPTVALTAPANGASFTAPATISLTATASDSDGSVAKVEFYNGGTKLGEDTTSPYAYAWTGVGAGTYTLTAKAIDNAGATTTSAAATVAVNAADAFGAQVNFQPSQSPTVAGWAVDSGAAYGDRGNGLTYGWIGGANSATRDRNLLTDQLRDTLIHLQKGADRSWEIAVPNGTYAVHVVMGDAGYTNQVNSIAIEGTLRNDGDGQDNFDEHEATVAVSDGKLTIAPAGTASNAKVCSIRISQVAPPIPVGGG